MFRNHKASISAPISDLKEQGFLNYFYLKTSSVWTAESGSQECRDSKILTSKEMVLRKENSLVALLSNNKVLIIKNN